MDWDGWWQQDSEGRHPWHVKSREWACMIGRKGIPRALGKGQGVGGRFGLGCKIWGSLITGQEGVLGSLKKTLPSPAHCHESISGGPPMDQLRGLRGIMNRNMLWYQLVSGHLIILLAVTHPRYMLVFCSCVTTRSQLLYPHFEA